MRADEHYVEHLTSRAPGPLIRMIPTHEIDSISESLSQPGLDSLIRSIRAHGVRQPLLVRKGDSGLSENTVDNASRFADVVGSLQVPAES